MGRVVAVLVAAAITLPAFASAYDPELQAQIAILQAQLGLPQTPLIEECIAPATYLARGARGNEVMALQLFLAQDTTLYPEGYISGFYGALTRIAVGRFQKKYLRVTSSTPGYGNVGPRTLALIRKQAGCLDQNPVSQSVPAENRVRVTSIDTVINDPLTQQHANVPASVVISFDEPVSDVVAVTGGRLSVAWKTSNPPARSFTSIALRRVSDREPIGIIASGLRTTARYFWSLPASHANPASCTNSLQCISQIADSICDGPFCALATGLYRIVGNVMVDGIVVATAESEIFRITNSTASASFEPSAISTSGTYTPVDSASFSGVTTGNVSSGPVEIQNTPRSCAYSGLSYADGITLTVNCADLKLPGTPCPAQYDGLVLTCRNGDWLNSAGATTSIPNVTQVPSGATCTTPWNNQIVGNGQLISYQPYFTNGQFIITGAVPMMKCASGSWQRCSAIGDACGPYTPVQ